MFLYSCWCTVRINERSRSVYQSLFDVPKLFCSSEPQEWANSKIYVKVLIAKLWMQCKTIAAVFLLLGGHLTKGLLQQKTTHFQMHLGHKPYSERHRWGCLDLTQSTRALQPLETEIMSWSCICETKICDRLHCMQCFWLFIGVCS